MASIDFKKRILELPENLFAPTLIPETETGLRARFVRWYYSADKRQKDQSKWMQESYYFANVLKVIYDPNYTKATELEDLKNELARLYQQYSSTRKDLKQRLAKATEFSQLTYIMKQLVPNERLGQEIERLCQRRINLFNYNGPYNSLNYEYSGAVPLLSDDPGAQIHKLKFAYKGSEGIATKFAAHSNQSIWRMHQDLGQGVEFSLDELERIAKSQRPMWGTRWIFKEREVLYQLRKTKLTKAKKRYQQHKKISTQLIYTRMNHFLLNMPNDLFTKFNGVMQEYTAEPITANRQLVRFLNDQDNLEAINRSACRKLAIILGKRKQNTLEVSVSEPDFQALGNAEIVANYTGAKEKYSYIALLEKISELYTQHSSGDRAKILAGQFAEYVKECAKIPNIKVYTRQDAEYACQVKLTEVAKRFGSLFPNNVRELLSQYSSGANETFALDIMRESSLILAGKSNSSLSRNPLCADPILKADVKNAFDFAVEERLRSKSRILKQQSRSESNTKLKLKSKGLSNLADDYALHTKYKARMSKSSLYESLGRLLLKHPGDLNPGEIKERYIKRINDYIKLLLGKDLVYSERSKLRYLQRLILGELTLAELGEKNLDQEQEVIGFSTIANKLDCLLPDAVNLRLIRILNLKGFNLTECLIYNYIKPIVEDYLTTVFHQIETKQDNDFEIDKLRAYFELYRAYFPNEESIVRRYDSLAKTAVEFFEHLLHVDIHEEMQPENESEIIRHLQHISISEELSMQLNESILQYVNRFKIEANKNINYGTLLLLVAKPFDNSVDNTTADPLRMYVEAYLDELLTYRFEMNKDFNSNEKLRQFFDRLYADCGRWPHIITMLQEKVAVYIDKYDWNLAAAEFIENYGNAENKYKYRLKGLKQNLRANNLKETKKYIQHLQDYSIANDNFVAPEYAAEIDDIVSERIDYEYRYLQSYQEKPRRYIKDFDNYSSQYLIDSCCQNNLFIYRLHRVRQLFLVCEDSQRVDEAYQLSAHVDKFISYLSQDSIYYSGRNYGPDNFAETATENEKLSVLLDTFIESNEPWSAAIQKVIMEFADPLYHYKYFIKGLSQALAKKDLKFSQEWLLAIKELGLDHDYFYQNYSVWQTGIETEIKAFITKNFVTKPVDIASFYLINQLATIDSKQELRCYRLRDLVQGNAEEYWQVDQDVIEQTELQSITHDLEPKNNFAAFVGYYGKDPQSISFQSKKHTTISFIELCKSAINSPKVSQVTNHLFAKYNFYKFLPKSLQKKFVNKQSLKLYAGEAVSALQTGKLGQAFANYNKVQSIYNKLTSSAEKVEANQYLLKLEGYFMTWVVDTALFTLLARNNKLSDVDLVRAKQSYIKQTATNNYETHLRSKILAEIEKDFDFQYKKSIVETYVRQELVSRKQTNINHNTIKDEVIRQTKPFFGSALEYPEAIEEAFKKYSAKNWITAEVETQALQTLAHDLNLEDVAMELSAIKQANIQTKSPALYSALYSQEDLDSDIEEFSREFAAKNSQQQIQQIAAKFYVSVQESKLNRFTEFFAKIKNTRFATNDYAYQVVYWLKVGRSLAAGQKLDLDRRVQKSSSDQQIKQVFQALNYSQLKALGIETYIPQLAEYFDLSSQQDARQDYSQPFSQCAVDAKLVEASVKKREPMTDCAVVI